MAERGNLPHPVDASGYGFYYNPLRAKFVKIDFRYLTGHYPSGAQSETGGCNPYRTGDFALQRTKELRQLEAVRRQMILL